MNTLRGWIFYFILGITVIPVCFAVLIAAPFRPVESRYDMMAAWGRFIIRTLRAVCGVRFEVRGMGNCPKEPAVVLSKHQSAWECIWLGSFLPCRAAYVYKKSLDRIPFLGWALWSLGQLGIDRSDGSGAFRTLMKKGPAFLKRPSWWIVLFPEGTRVPPGSRVKHKSGGARLAVASGVPIIPVALDSGLCWPKNSVAKVPGVITVSIGRPMPTKGRSAKEVATEAEEWIERESASLLGEARSHA